MEVQTEQFDGSDCSGNDGASNRVLTLTNTGLTSQGGFSVTGTGNLSWIGSSGYFICDAQLNLTNRNAPPSSIIFYWYDGCEVRRL